MGTLWVGRETKGRILFDINVNWYTKLMLVARILFFFPNGSHILHSRLYNIHKTHMALVDGVMA